ncbi:MAG: hypothetical protein WC107_02745 [Patescibacteria group bacterium]
MTNSAEQQAPAEARQAEAEQQAPQMTPEQQLAANRSTVLQKSRQEAGFLNFLTKASKAAGNLEKGGVLAEGSAEDLEGYIQKYEQVKEVTKDLSDVYEKSIFKGVGKIPNEAKAKIVEYLNELAINDGSEFQRITQDVKDFKQLEGAIGQQEKELEKYGDLEKIREEREKSDSAAQEKEAELEALRSEREENGDLYAGASIKVGWIKKRDTDPDEAARLAKLIQENDGKIKAVSGELEALRKKSNDAGEAIQKAKDTDTEKSQSEFRYDVLKKQFIEEVGVVKDLKNIAIKTVEERCKAQAYTTETVHNDDTDEDEEVTELSEDFDSLSAAAAQFERVADNQELDVAGTGGATAKGARETYKTVFEQLKAVMSLKVSDTVSNTSFTIESNLGQMEKALGNFVKKTEGNPGQRAELINALKDTRKEMAGSIQKKEAVTGEEQKLMALNLIIGDLETGGK